MAIRFKKLPARAAFASLLGLAAVASPSWAYAADGPVSTSTVMIGACVALAMLAAFLGWRLVEAQEALSQDRDRRLEDLRALDDAERRAEAFARRVNTLREEIETVRALAAAAQQQTEDVERARDAADKANRSKTDFLAMMSHELRTPLNAILGFSEIIRTEALGELGCDEYRDYAGDIYASGQHLLALINDLLDLAKVESGMVELREETVDAAALVKDSVRIVAKTDAAAGVEVASEFPSSLPVMKGDKRKLRQIMMNLLSNAVKFTPPGKAVRASVKVEPSGGLTFEVSDQGIGIAEADVARVMEPFVQIDTALNRAHQGTGLGLPLCKELAELHGAKFEIESEVNVGTTVRIRMPAARSVAAVAAA